MNTCSTTRWSDLEERAEGQLLFHINRTGSLGGTSTPLHTHDGFAEVFWVEQGTAIHEFGGGDFPLRRGDIVFVCSDDVHRYRAPSRDFQITNLAFPNAVVADLRQRYFHDGPAPWDVDRPRMFHQDDHSMVRLRGLGADLGHGRPSQLHLDRFLLELLTCLESPLPTGAPIAGWLSDALTRWRNDPAAMRDGVSGLAELAGRSREHVSRVVRSSTGQRANDVLNALRMEVAAGRLRMSDAAIAHIAADVGLPNLSHFYEIFRRRFGTTPRKFRISQRRTISPEAPA